MADDGLGNMFDDLDFGAMTVASPTQNTPGKGGMEAQRKNMMTRTRSDSLSRMTLRGVEQSIDIDDLIAMEDQKQEKRWIPKYAVGDLVEALWQEDGVWYAAKIDAVGESGYDVTFVEYGNSQENTPEDDVRLSVAAQYSKAVENMPQVQRRKSNSEQAQRRKSGDDPVSRTSQSTMVSMADAFDSIIEGEETAKMLSQYPEDMDFSTLSLQELPDLPNEPPPIQRQAEYKNYMKLKYEHQRRLPQSPLKPSDLPPIVIKSAPAEEEKKVEKKEEKKGHRRGNSISFRRKSKDMDTLSGADVQRRRSSSGQGKDKDHGLDTGSGTQRPKSARGDDKKRNSFFSKKK